MGFANFRQQENAGRWFFLDMLTPTHWPTTGPRIYLLQGRNARGREGWREVSFSGTIQTLQHFRVPRGHKSSLSLSLCLCAIPSQHSLPKHGPPFFFARARASRAGSIATNARTQASCAASRVKDPSLLGRVQETIPTKTSVHTKECCRCFEKQRKNHA
jgi:hypothetical protein